jgi:hypothetical protein
MLFKERAKVEGVSGECGIPIIDPHKLKIRANYCFQILLMNYKPSPLQ